MCAVGKAHCLDYATGQDTVCATRTSTKHLHVLWVRSANIVGLLRAEYIHNLVYSLVDMSFEIQAKGYHRILAGLDWPDIIMCLSRKYQRVGSLGTSKARCQFSVLKYLSSEICVSRLNSGKVPSDN